MIWVHPNGHAGSRSTVTLAVIFTLRHCVSALSNIHYTPLDRDRQIRRKEGMPMLHSLRDLLIGIIASLLATAILRFLDSLELLK